MASEICQKIVRPTRAQGRRKVGNRTAKMRREGATAAIRRPERVDTDMSQAAAQTVGYVDRSRAFLPPGTVSPSITRFDAGSVRVDYLVFSSSTRSVGKIHAPNRVRPWFATRPGVSAPPPFGGNQRTIVVSVDPDRLRAYRMSPEEVIQALSSGIPLTLREMCEPGTFCG